MKLNQKSIHELSKDLRWAFENSEKPSVLMSHLEETFTEHGLKDLVNFYCPQATREEERSLHLNVAERRVSIRLKRRNHWKTVKTIDGIPRDNDKTVLEVGHVTVEPTAGWEAAGVLPGEKAIFQDAVEGCIALIVDWMILNKPREDFFRELAELESDPPPEWSPEHQERIKVNPGDRATFSLIVEAVNTGCIPKDVAFRCLMEGMRRYLNFSVSPIETELLSMLLTRQGPEQ